MSTLVNFEEELRFEKIKNEKMEEIEKLKLERNQKFSEFDKEFLSAGPENLILLILCLSISLLLL